MSRKFYCIAAVIWVVVGVFLFFAMIPDHMTVSMMWERIARWAAGLSLQRRAPAPESFLELLL